MSRVAQRTQSGDASRYTTPDASAPTPTPERVPLPNPSSAGDILRVPLGTAVETSQTAAAHAADAREAAPERIAEARQGVADARAVVPADVESGLTISGSVLGFLYALKGLYTAMSEGETREKVRTGYAQVVKAGGIIKDSMSAAVLGGASIATAAIPGVGLAVSCLEILVNVATLVEGYVAQSENAERLEAAEEGSTEKLAYQRVASDIERRISNSKGQVAGDVVKITGGVLQLAVGPVGAMVAIAGVLIKLGTTGSTFKEKRASNKKRPAAHAEVQQAELSADPERIHAAKRELVQADTVAAIHEIVSRATTVAPDATDLDPAMKRLLGSFGIGVDLLARLFATASLPADDGARRSALSATERQVQIFLDASSYDPRGITEVIGDALAAAGEWIRTKVRGGPAPDPYADESELLTASHAQFALQPVVGDYFGDPKEWEGDEPDSNKLSELIARTHRALVKTYVAKSDDSKQVARRKALDLGLMMAIEQEALSKRLTIPLGKMKISDGVVYFPASDRTEAITADVRHALGPRSLDVMLAAIVERPSASRVAKDLTTVLETNLTEIKNRYTETLLKRRDRTAAKGRIDVMDRVAAAVLKDAARLVANSRSVPIERILPGELTVKNLVVTIAPRADVEDAAPGAASDAASSPETDRVLADA